MELNYLLNDLFADLFCVILVDLPKIFILYIIEPTTLLGVIGVTILLYWLFTEKPTPPKKEGEPENPPVTAPWYRRLWNKVFPNTADMSEEQQKEAARRSEMGWKALQFSKEQEQAMKKSAEAAKKAAQAEAARRAREGKGN